MMKSVTNTTVVPLFVRHLVEERNKCAELLNTWREWVMLKPSDSGEHRDLAFERLKDCLVYRHSWLGMSGLGLTALPDLLPDFLQELDISYNALTSLPEILSESLEVLHVDSNCLTCLPAHLPASLVMIDVSDNRLTHLPASLPMGLKDLNASINHLTVLPAVLPAELNILDVSDNRLMCIPDTLPASITTLHIDRNCLRALPMLLPNSLEILDVSHNQLASFPASLPMSLRTLDISHNQLVCLPATLPDALEMLFAENNPLKDTSILASGNLPIGASVYPAIIGFLAKIRCWDNDIDTKPWETIYAEANAKIFAVFLHKLHQGKNSQNKELHQRVAHWLRYLAKVSHGELRKQTFALASEATESCVDRASFYFNHMYILMVEHQLLGRDVPLMQIIDTVKGTFRLQVLERLAEEKAALRRQNAPGFAEDLEIYLAYQYKLRQRLFLPVYTELQFEQISGVTNEDIVRAELAVFEAEKTHFGRYWLTESALWTAKLAEWDPVKKAETDNRYLDKISSADFNKAVCKALIDKGICADDIDAHRNVSQNLAADLFYQLRYRLTRQLFAAFQALSWFDKFHFPSWLMTEKTESIDEKKLLNHKK